MGYKPYLNTFSRINDNNNNENSCIDNAHTRSNLNITSSGLNYNITDH